MARELHKPLQDENDLDEEILLDKTMSKKLFSKTSIPSSRPQRPSTADKSSKDLMKTIQNSSINKSNFILMNKRLVARKPIQNNFTYH